MNESDRDRIARGSELIVLRYSQDGDCSFWLPGMTPERLEDWWRSQPTLEGVPSEAIEEWIMNPSLPEPEPCPFKLPGEELVATTEEDQSLWNALSTHGGHYTCQLCCDDDSVLTDPNRRTIHHKGYRRRSPRSSRTLNAKHPWLATAPHSVLESYYSSGCVVEHIHIDTAKRLAEGHAFWNYPGGQRMVQGCYRHGVRAGNWTWFTRRGKVTRQLDMGAGEYVILPTPLRSAWPEILPDTTILLGEEYGFRSWFWLPDGPLPALLDWWRELPSVTPWTYSPETLPGMVLLAKDADETRWCELHRSGRFHTGHINVNDDSSLRTPDGHQVLHAGALHVHQHGIV